MSTPLRISADFDLGANSAHLRELKDLPRADAKNAPGQSGAAAVVQFPDVSNSSNKHASGLLTSWKDISSYLSRGVRTVQRWEKTLGLPVHRMGDSERAPVFALEHEIDAWLRQHARMALVTSSKPNGKGRDRVNPRQQWLLDVIQDLRAGALEVEQDVLTEGSEPDTDLTVALLATQKLMNAALGRNHAPGVQVNRTNGQAVHGSPTTKSVAGRESPPPPSLRRSSPAAVNRHGCCELCGVRSHTRGPGIASQSLNL